MTEEQKKRKKFETVTTRMGASLGDHQRVMFERATEAIQAGEAEEEALAQVVVLTVLSRIMKADTGITDEALEHLTWIVLEAMKETKH